MTLTKCRAITSIGDDFGDNSCTFHCQLEQGHSGLHTEKFEINGKLLTMTWDGTEFINAVKASYNVVRTCVDLQGNKYEQETLLTEVMSERDMILKYDCLVEGSEDGTMFWEIDSFEPVEGTVLTTQVYEDTLES